ncbi:hypothetical protein SAMN06297129_2146 [Pseudooceanicola antarcticus]|uniref:Uncharacterized protein n=1 Tax=Pseudooceanicola antarcticus TaxID=1247613 RepID=A0A285IUX6_9RHOB|nr:hypothetical protein [Pseudooceanicola antarcticus]PJE32085.1 hypothetical protein CVM39_03075 [Pseudooceanicola antarcticus]SNY51497.1 hypothetical protein SAMN06297129_2146 [Pseudooceanicola antarcticus]
MIPAVPGQDAEPFHDILDGYFTLKESVRQLMARHQLSWAWLMLSHAPVMEIAGLAPDAPVPLHLRDTTYAGLIDAMTLTVVASGEGESHEAHLVGAGDWRWLDARAETSLPADIRLAEPAYLTGFGLSAKPNAKRITAEEVLADVPHLLSEASGFRPFSA